MNAIPLADGAEFVLDGTHGSPVRTDSGVPVLSAQNVHGGRLDYKTDRFTTEDEYEAFRSRLEIRAGDVLLTIVGSIGRAAVITETRPLVFQRSVAIIRPKRSILNSRFLYHVTQSRGFQRQLAQATNQSSQAGVYLGRLKKIVIPLPSINEQQRIASTSDRAEKLRTKRREALAHLEGFIQSIFLDMFGDPRFNAKGWPFVALSTLISPGDRINYGVIQPGENEDGGVPLVRVGDLINRRVDRTSLKHINHAIEARYSRSRLRGNEILISCVGSIGVVALVDEHDVGSNIARAVARVPLEDQDLRPYVAAYLQTQAVQEYFTRELRTVSQPTLNIKQIGETPILLPPREMRQEFTERLTAVERLTAAHRASLAELDALFASLQDRAFRGLL